MVAIALHSNNDTMEVNCLITNILQNIFFCVQQKKETHTGLKRHKGE